MKNKKKKKVSSNSKQKRVLFKKNKRKIIELKNSKKIKEILPEKIKSGLEKEIEETNVPKFKDILKKTESSPVLERVAVAESQENLEQEIAFSPVSEKEDGEIKYQEIGYESIGGGGYLTTNPQNNAENNFHYTTSSDIQRTGFQDDEANIETRRRISRGDIINQTDNRMERIPRLEDTKETRETKKYLTQGDYK